jgi:predicted dienelactone hydrolase
MRNSAWFCSVACIAAANVALSTHGADRTYDPLAVTDPNHIQTLDLTVKDDARNREIPIRVYLPATKSPQPVVLFSHGLGGSRNGSVYLGNHWAARSYVAVFLQHPGSDTSVWQDKPAGERMDAMRQAANLQNFLLRAKDVHAVLDQLEHWNVSNDHPLAKRLDMNHVGMSGHSFGAITTQAVSGQMVTGLRQTLTDPRIKAAVIMSPSSPIRGNAKQAFARVAIPWLLMTGTKDVAPIGNADVPSRLAVFASLPPGHKYELVLDRAEHSAFSDRALPIDTEKRNPNHHRVILALSTAFWDAYLRENPAAQAWLDGDGPRSLLEKDDRWEAK